MDIGELLLAWPLDGQFAVQPLSPGNNNLSYAVTTPHTQYILRIYQNSTEPEQIRYEHILLTELNRLELSFAVPAPIPTRSASTLIAIPDEASQQLAALFQRIPGQQPDGDDLVRYRRCGKALAELDHALSRLIIQTPSTPRPPFGDLRQIHPFLPEPFTMLEQLPVEQQQRTQLSQIVHNLATVLPQLYQSLPQQIVHRDFDASNVLMVDGRVSGVLDFEFAGPDLRAYDLARSLSMFTISPWNIPNGWQQVTAFIEGYRQHLLLSADEVEAIPHLMRLYRTWSLIHREGRRRQGWASEEDVQARARGLLNQEAWLSAYGRDLARLVGLQR
jgi:homoserine kinase type II